MFAFLRQTFRRFHDTGAIAPSSRWLGRALAAPLSERGEGPMAILEAGPGTGAVTREIVRHLRPDDHLTLCEINPVFAEHLRNRFESDARLRPHRDRVTIVQAPVESLEGEGCFDHIVCGLPFFFVTFQKYFDNEIGDKSGSNNKDRDVSRQVCFFLLGEFEFCCIRLRKRI